MNSRQDRNNHLNTNITLANHVKQTIRSGTAQTYSHQRLISMWMNMTGIFAAVSATIGLDIFWGKLTGKICSSRD